MTKTTKGGRKATPQARRKARAPQKPVALLESSDASLKQQLAEARAQQAATAEILKVIASSPSDVQPVFDAIAASAMRLVGGFSCVVTRLVGETIHLGAVTSTSPAGDAAVRQQFPQALAKPDGNFGSAIKSRAPYLVCDSESDPRLTADFRDVARARGFRSVVAVPMLREGEAIGSLSVSRREPGPFPKHQVDLLTTFANQAVLAIENVRLFNETREALERQTATAAILKVIASSPSDVQPVFDAIVRSAERLFSRRATLRIAEPGGMRLKAASGGLRSETIKEVMPINEESLIGQVALFGKAFQFSDLRGPDAPPFARQHAHTWNFRANAGAPLIRDGKAIGVITVTSPEVGAMTEKQMELLATFANQAVIAIENARLFNETRESLERQTATAEILKVIASSPSDVQPVFDAIVACAERLFPGRRTTVRIVDGDKLILRARAGSPVPVEAASLVAVMPVNRDSLVGQVILDCRLIEVTDTMGPDAPAFLQRNAAKLPFRSMSAAPLLRNDKAIGVIALYSTEPGELPDRQKQLLQTFADQAVIAIENVRLFNETKALNEERLARLKSFFSPQLADLLAAGKGDELLKTHRREITVQFFDLRGFTAFTGAAEPEEVMELLHAFHGALGKLVMEQQGTIERFAGDSVMVFFNDPLPVDRPAERAMQSATAMMRAFDPIAALWKKRGYDLGLGAGIAQGFATLGAIGFEGRRDYAAIGPVTNLAARLCAEAAGGQILADRKTVAALEGAFEFDALGDLDLKGFAKPVPAFALRRA